MLWGMIVLIHQTNAASTYQLLTRGGGCTQAVCARALKGLALPRTGHSGEIAQSGSRHLRSMLAAAPVLFVHAVVTAARTRKSTTPTLDARAGSSPGQLCSLPIQILCLQMSTTACASCHRTLQHNCDLSTHLIDAGEPCFVKDAYDQCQDNQSNYHPTHTLQEQNKPPQQRNCSTTSHACQKHRLHVKGTHSSIACHSHSQKCHTAMTMQDGLHYAH